MSIELIAILAGYGLTGLVWWRMESLHRSLKQTMMAQFGYVIREIRRCAIAVARSVDRAMLSDHIATPPLAARMPAQIAIRT